MIQLYTNVKIYLTIYYNKSSGGVCMSMDLQIAVVDDEEIQVRSMKSLINQAAEEINITVKIETFSSGEQFLFELEDYVDLDMVFLDIEMNQIDGLEVAKKIREVDEDLTIVFATAFVEYAVQGYKVQALDYLLKPMDSEKVKRVLQRHMDKKPFVQESMTIESNGEIVKILLDDIFYIEANKRQCEIHLKDQVLTTNKRLKELSDELNEDFIQTHRSYLVHVKAINRLLKTDVELVTKETVPVSRRLAKEVQEKFIKYHKGSVFYDE